QTLETELRSLLGENLLGIYLHGSLAQGGFQPARSDIDIIVVSEQGIEPANQLTIVEMLLRLSKAPIPLDIYFLAKSAIFPFQQHLPYDLHYNERQREHYQVMLRRGEWQNDLDQRDPLLNVYLAILHTYGIVLAGKPIAETLPIVPDQTLRESLVAATLLARDERLQDLVSFVLNACRTLAYLREGTLISKEEGGIWGETHLPEQYAALIHQSLALYRGDRLSRPVGRVVLDEFAEYVKGELLA
ncbi:MAG TPA: aminoglycoside adenylyltransferase domain-containing protein, partial [Ktedonobacteraceae bacterium]|nr:aminoglycoside adenylyltransferase domain-containing protein [Ktedonobacteraceae bacterium]